MNPPTPPLPGLPPALQPDQKKKTHWVLWGGCGCLGIVLIGALFSGLMFFGVSKIMKSTGPYETAFKGAAESPLVQAALGTPIEAGLMPMGNVVTSFDSGSANLTISISGPKGAGTIHFRATRSKGEWHTHEHTVRIERTNELIDLLRHRSGFSI